MRGLGLLLALACAVELPAQVPVEVLTLKEKPQPVATATGHVLAGRKLTGKLLSLDAGGIKLAGADGPLEVAAADLLDVRFPPRPNAPPPAPATSWVRLVDGSRIACLGLVATPRQTKLKTVHLGSLTLPAERVAAVRFGVTDGTLGEAWRELLGRTIKRDRLVVRKGDTLDYLDGVIGEVTEKAVKFLLDGDELTVTRERVYGMIFFRKATPPAKVACEAALLGKDRLLLSAVSLTGGRCQATLVGGQQVELPLARLVRLDFAGSRMVYLSDLVPRDVKYTPYFDVTWKYHRDRNLDGGPLKVGGKMFRRGLALHSKTRLVYSLAGRHRRFQAWMGIDALVGKRGNVHVVISADGKVLLETDVKGVDPPRLVDLDVSGRRELRILVDFGADLDIADHLDLADARLIR